jgi:hypothetical protein
MEAVFQTKAQNDAGKSESPRTTILMLTESEEALRMDRSFARVHYPWPWVCFSTTTLPANERYTKVKYPVARSIPMIHQISPTFSP